MAISIILFGLWMLFLAFSLDGTGDDGDSISHFLFSRYAFQHPENFLNHWAKPVFVFLTAPFAQLGFIAIKIFNIVLLCCTLWLTYLIAQSLRIAQSFLVVVLLMAMPMLLYKTLSGLTEPLFSFWLMVGIYGFTKKRPLLAVLWLSFLPFVRSEGLVVFCVIGIYLLLIRKWYLIPLLMFGHLIMSIVGYFHYGDFLWIFNKMTYATLESVYGMGRWSHFILKLPDVVGSVIYLLLGIGLVSGMLRLVQYWKGQGGFLKEELWLIYGMFVAYLIAHSIFWSFGLFNSYGLMRVMIGVAPLMAIIALRGILAVVALLPFQKWKPVVLRLIIPLLLLLFLWKQPHLKSQFDINVTQSLQKEIIEKHLSNYSNYTWYLDAPYAALKAKVDWFDPQQKREARQLFTGEPLPPKAVVLWEDHYVLEKGVTLDTLLRDQRFVLIEKLEQEYGSGSVNTVALFELDSQYSQQKLLFEENFEQRPKHKLIERENTGNQYAKIQNVAQYSPSFKAWINSMQNKKLRFSFLAKMPELPKAASGLPRAVISFESLYKPFQWNSEDIFKLMGKQTGVWKKVEMEVAVPSYKIYTDKVNIYVWNRSYIPIWIDDMKVELVD